MDEIIAKRYRKLYHKKVKYVKFANRQLNTLKASQENINETLKRLKKKQDEEKLEKSIQKYKAEAELKEKREAANVEREYANVKREAARKAKEKLKKRFF